MAKIPNNWPSGALPRLLSRDQAAFYVGVSVNTFMREVGAHVWPAGQRRGERILWDRALLDDVIDARSGLLAAPSGASAPNPWD